MGIFLGLRNSFIFILICCIVIYFVSWDSLLLELNLCFFEKYELEYLNGVCICWVIFIYIINYEWGEYWICVFGYWCFISIWKIVFLFKVEL